MPDPLLAVIIGRLFERGLIILGAILALWFGFRLFALTSNERSNAQVSGHGFAFKAERIGPGIFFALFGSITLVYSVYSNVYFSQGELKQLASADRSGQPAHVAKTVYMGIAPGRENEIPPPLLAVNTLVSVKSRQGDGSTQIIGVDYKNLMSAIPLLEYFQRQYVDAQYGQGAFDVFIAMEKECVVNSSQCRSFRNNENNREQMDKIREIIGSILR